MPFAFAVISFATLFPITFSFLFLFLSWRVRGKAGSVAFATAERAGRSVWLNGKFPVTARSPVAGTVDGQGLAWQAAVIPGIALASPLDRSFFSRPTADMKYYGHKTRALGVTELAETRYLLFIGRAQRVVQICFFKRRLKPTNVLHLCFVSRLWCRTGPSTNRTVLCAWIPFLPGCARVRIMLMMMIVMMVNDP